MKKRLFIPLLALCTTLALLTVFISAEEAPPTSGDCGSSATWSYDQASKTLTISGSGRVETGYSYNSVYNQYIPWYNEIEVVQFEGTDFSSLEREVFYGWSNLSSITLPEGITEIGMNAFKGCSALTSIIIPESVGTIRWGAFSGCSKLVSVIIPPKVWEIGYRAFTDCASLTEIQVNQENRGYISVDGVLFTWKQDDLITFPAGKQGSYSIPGSVTKIEDEAFKGCSGLTSVSIPDGVTSIGYGVFSGCSKLANITIPDGITSIGSDMFEECSSLVSVTIPESVTFIDFGAFRGCSSLVSVTIPENVTSIRDAVFKGCSKLANITIPEGITRIAHSMFKECSSLISVTIPESVTSIAPEAFAGCSSLADITIPDGVTSIDYKAFAGCSSLADITIPDGVTSIGYEVFDRCSNLANVVIQGGVTRIEHRTFNDCSSLISVTIPKSVTSIDWQAFKGCSSLASITIPEGVTEIGSSAFSGCSSLDGVTIPNSVTSIDGYAFEGCSSLASITISEGVTSIGQWSFKDCTSLTEIQVDPNNTNYVSVEGVLLNHAKNNIVAFPAGKQGPYSIPEGVTSIRRDFQNCKNLTSVTIPQSVTSIEFHAFAGCSNLKSLFCNGKKAPVIGEFWAVTDYPLFDRESNAVIYVYAGSSDYTIDFNWPEDKIVYLPCPPTVTYDANGGTGEMPDVQMQEGETLTLPTCGFTAPENQKFKIWSIANVEYAPGSTYVVTCDTTVKAIWEKDGKPVPPDDETYAITVSGTITNGKVETNVKEAAAGTTVTVTATPNPGYKVGEITVTKSDGSKVPVTNGAFQMPAGNVTVSASFTASTTSKLSAVWRANEENILKGELVIQGTSAEKWYLIEMKKADPESSLTNSVFFTLRGDESGTLIVQCENGVTLNMYEMDGNKISDFANGHQFVQDQTADGPLEIL